MENSDNEILILKKNALRPWEYKLDENQRCGNGWRCLRTRKIISKKLKASKAGMKREWNAEDTLVQQRNGRTAKNSHDFASI